MEVPNWSSSLLSDEDYSKLVKQFYVFIEKFNVDLAKNLLDPDVRSMVKLTVYATTYEVAGKRLLRAVEFFEGKEMNELGSAIRKLREKNYKFPYFDIELRNGLSHQNFLIESAKVPLINYANIHVPRGGASKSISRFSINISDVNNLTISLSLFLMAVSYVHASRYLGVVNDLLSVLP